MYGPTGHKPAGVPDKPDRLALADQELDKLPIVFVLPPRPEEGRQPPTPTPLQRILSLLLKGGKLAA